MPIALAGIAKEFQMRLPDEEFVGGLWRSALPESLLWGIAEDADREVSPSIIVAPSWSWLSSSSAVKLAHRHTTNLVLPLSVINDIKLEHVHQDPLGPLTRGSIQITGYLRRIRFSGGKKSLKLGVYEPSGDGTVRDMGEAWDDYEGSLFECSLDFISEMKVGGIDCFFLPITITATPGDNYGVSTRRIAGLLLTPDSADGHYRRIGTLNVNDLFSLKMRYSVRAPHEPTESEWAEFQDAIREAYDQLEQESKESEGKEREDGDEEDEDDEQSAVGSETGATEALDADTENIYWFDQGYQPKWLEQVDLRTITLV